MNGFETGKQAEVTLIMRLLNRRVGEVAEEVHDRIHTLSFAQLEELGEALLDFSTMPDLLNWLEQQEL